MMRCGLILLLSLYCAAFCGDIRIVYLGIVPGGAPEFENRCARLIEEKITGLSNVSIADYNETENLKEITGFNSNPAITRRFIEKLTVVSENTGEKLLIVWAEITNFTIEPVRRWLVGAEAVGEVSLSLTMYSLDFREYAYLGEIRNQEHIPKPPVFFRNVSEVTHISAEDRSTLITKLQDAVSRRAADVVGTVVVNRLIKSGQLRDGDAEAKKIPTVSDLFDIPTVEAPDLGKSGGKSQSAVQDTGTTRGRTQEPANGKPGTEGVKQEKKSE